MAPVAMMPVVASGSAAAAPAFEEPMPFLVAPLLPTPQLVPIRDTAPAPQAADPELVRAAVTLALDAAMPALIDELTQRVLAALIPPEGRKVNHG